MMIKSLMGAFVAVVLISGVAAASEQLDPWQAQVQQADSIWWEVAFNHCDEKKFTEMLSEDAEFIHDEIGIYRGKKDLVALIMKNVCQYSDMRREAVPATMRYDLLKDVRDNKIYGAIVTGEQLFYAINPGKADKLVSRARFTNVMLFDGANWTLSRLLSYSHKSAASEKK